MGASVMLVVYTVICSGRQLSSVHGACCVRGRLIVARMLIEVLIQQTGQLCTNVHRSSADVFGTQPIMPLYAMGLLMHQRCGCCSMIDTVVAETTSARSLCQCPSCMLPARVWLNVSSCSLLFVTVTCMHGSMADHPFRTFVSVDRTEVRCNLTQAAMLTRTRQAVSQSDALDGWQ